MTSTFWKPDHLSVLILEDDLDMRLFIRRMLGRDPRFDTYYESDEASQAIALAKSKKPDLIILDQYIQGIATGLDAAPLLKKVAPCSRIILFTGQDLFRMISGVPAIDAYVPKAYLSKLLPTAQKLIQIEHEEHEGCARFVAAPSIRDVAKVR